jgi:hypothetical protein
VYVGAVNEEGNEERQAPSWAALSSLEFIRVAEADGRISLLRALARIEIGDRMMDAVELIVQTQHEHRLNEAEAAAAAGVELTVSVAAALLLTYVYRWEDAFNATLRLTAVVDPSLLPTGAVEKEGDGALLHWIFEAAYELAWLKPTIEDAGDDAAAVDRQASRASAAFRRLARVLAAAGAADDAFACALSAVNLAIRSEQTIESVELALTLSADQDDPAVSLLLKARQAEALLHRCRDDPRLAIKAFDAIESVVRHAADAPEAAADVLARLGAGIDTVPPLRALAPLVGGALGHYPEDPIAKDVLGLLVSMRWELSLERLFELREPFGAAAIRLENLRRDLEPAAPASAAETKWATWAFDYPPFRRAVPHGQSLARETGLDELLLTVAHETIHVLSMGSGLGRAVIALRLALLELEFRLWTYMGPADPEAFTSVGVAPLRAGDIAALAQAEPALEITRKLQILEDVWSPWLEGLAIFGEVAADAPDDPVDSIVSSVLTNLLDEPVRETAAERGCSVVDVISERQHEATARYAAAGQRVAAARLRTMLTEYAPKYLPGYLTVRAIVARWRRVCSRPCDAQMAFRALLHATQYGTDEAIPDLALSAREFREAALAGLRNWLEQLAAVSAADLEAFRDPPAEGDQVLARWVGGRLTTELPAEDLVAWTMEGLLSQSDRALMTLAGLHGDLNRVDDGEEETRYLLEGAAHGLALQRFSLSDLDNNPGLVERLVGRALLLPIGRARCPFWLLKPSSRLVVLVRTHDPPTETGEPRHQLFASQLSEPVAAELEREMRVRRDSRMTVARMADLLVFDPYGARRGLGVNYLVFAYGNWVHVEPRGLAFGSSYVPEGVSDQARERIQPDSILDFESELTSEGVAGAWRTLNWIRDVEEWTAGRERYAAENWAAHVADMAREVLTPSNHEEVRAASDLMLDMVVDRDHVDSLRERGLEVVRSAGSPTWIGELARVLVNSSDGPVASDFLDQHADAVNASLGAVFANGRHGWDAQPIAEEA